MFRKFSRFLTMTLLVFVGISLALTAGSLCGILIKTMTQEYALRLRLQQAEASRILENRLKYLEDRVYKMSLDNAIRVNLMLGVKSKVQELIEQQYPFYNGALFLIRENGYTDFIPELPESLKFTRPYLEEFGQGERLKTSDSVNSKTVAFTLYAQPLSKKSSNVSEPHTLFTICPRTAPFGNPLKKQMPGYS